MTISQFGIFFGGTNPGLPLKIEALRTWRLFHHKTIFPSYISYIYNNYIYICIYKQWVSQPGFRTYSPCFIFFWANHSLTIFNSHFRLPTLTSYKESSLGPWSNQGLSSTKRIEEIGFCLEKKAFNRSTCGLSKTIFQFWGVQHHLINLKCW